MMSKTRLFTLIITIFVLLLPAFLWAGTIQLPQTGQTKCYDTNGAEISCTGTGQDGEIRAGVAWPDPRFNITYCNTAAPCTNQSSDCDGKSFTDVVIDNLTGLMWARNGNLPNNTMTWYRAIDYANNLNLCGYSDWRLPNINELESLFNSGTPDTAMWLNTQGFNNVQPGTTYWSSTTLPGGDPSFAWIINMTVGYADAYYKSFWYAVWPVHAGQYDSPDSTYPANIWKTGQTTSYAAGDDGDMEMGVAWPNPRFTDKGNGTVADNLTGLIWTKDANAPGPSACSPGTSRTWQDALDYVACLNTNNYLGYNDWRLPNRIELRNLIDYSNYAPPLQTGHPFTGVQSYYDDWWYAYWSSTHSYYDENYTWSVGMFAGDVSLHNAMGSYYVWPVRGRAG